MLLVTNGAFAQAQQPPTEPKPRDAGWAPPTISEPFRPYLSEPSASGGSGSGLAGTTPILHESAKLTASDAAEGDGFGFTVSVSGDTAVVRAHSSDCAAGVSCGAAYVFRFNGNEWVEEQKLTASDAAENDRFGISVTIDGDIVVVGAPQDSCTAGSECGSVYVFRLSGATWIEERKLIASDASDRDFFGASISVSGDTIIVGAPLDDCVQGGRCGSAYVFRFDGIDWIEEQKLTAPDASSEDQFGISVSIGGDIALVGANRDDCAAGIQCGSAYLFRFTGTTWAEIQKLTASDAVNNRFGSVVHTNGDRVAAGAPLGRSAYIFRFDGERWVQEQKLSAPKGQSWSSFGTSIYLMGETVVVGANLDNCEEGRDCGSAHVFRFNGMSWVEERKLAASDAAARDWFGVSVSASGGVVIVGAVGDDCAESDRCGAAYVFNLGPDELEVAIDIKPGNDINPVNLSARGALPVAVLTTSVADGDLTDFDAADVDPSSLTLAGAAPRMKGRSGRVGSLADIDGDGDFDLLLHFPIAELELALPEDGDGGPCPPYGGNGGRCPPYTIEAVLLGQTFDGTPIRGSDTITAIQAQRIGAESMQRAE